MPNILSLIPFRNWRLLFLVSYENACHVCLQPQTEAVQNQELDTFNYINVNDPNAKDIVLNLKDEMNLVDPFRILYENSKQYTWRKRNPVKQARLDFFLLYESLMTSVKD